MTCKVDYKPSKYNLSDLGPDYRNHMMIMHLAVQAAIEKSIKL